MSTRRDALWIALGHFDESPEEAPGSVLVPVLAEHGVEEHPLAVDGAVEIAPAPGEGSGEDDGPGALTLLHLGSQPTAARAPQIQPQPQARPLRSSSRVLDAG